MEHTLTGAAPSRTAPLDREIAAENFDRLVCLHQRRIYRVLLAVLRDAEAADTLTQECFLRAYQKRQSFRGEAAVGTWLVRIALNLARDHQKSRRQSFWRRLIGSASEDTEAAAAGLPDGQASPERVLLAREQARAVARTVDHLPARQKEVFLLRFVEEMTLEEIAQATDLEIGTVKSHLSRALATVRQKTRGEK
ncbi:MAG: RNA polymerase sigma factor [Terriglobales bacterium]